jgi:raffinose/stachyose/melibiose transport system permease protein
VDLEKTKALTGRTIAYIVLVGWALITILPLFWMTYSSFKSNEELTRNIYAFPHDLFSNAEDEYVVIAPQLNVIPDYDPETDTRERLIIESVTISPGRRLMVYFLVKEELPPEIASLEPGDRLILSDLPAGMRRNISWKTMIFNYRSAISRGGLGQKFINSLIYAGVSTFLINLLALMTAFALSKMQFRKLSLVVGGLIGLGYLISINSVIIPLFLMLSKVGLTDTHVGIILVYTAFGLPLAVLLDTQFIRGIPDSLVESARMDGASTFRVLLAIIIPIATPVVVTVSIITALGIWNEFLLVLVLASSEFTKSLPVGVFSFSSLTSTQLGWQLAALVVATAPVMLVYVLFQRQLAEGVVGGAIKG